MRAPAGAACGAGAAAHAPRPALIHWARERTGGQDPLRPIRGRAADCAGMAGLGAVPSRARGRGREQLLDRDSATERDRVAAHGPRVPRLDHGLPDPLPPHARAAREVDPRHRPRRDRHPDAGRERCSRSEGTSRQELGREAFERRVWQWREEYGGTIIEQLKRLGASCDYADERFTLDPAYADAVLRVFVALHEKGYIYRDRYMVNWDPGTRSAISDLEVEDREVTDTLYYIDYPLASGSGAVTIATVRPETMLADTAIAVHPDDDRYRRLIGEKAILPIVGRRLKIIADDYVKPEFGTGALKITPGHDPNDFDIGRRHGLQQLSVIGEDGRITDQAPERFVGMTIGEAQEAVVAELREQGLIARSEPYTHTVPFSHRSGERIEPLVSLQWFMAMDELAGPAIEVVTSGRVRFYPERWSRVYLDWMENIRPWCISRQLWWGHRIPVWYRGDETYVGLSEPPGRWVDTRSRRARHVVLERPVAVRDARLARADGRAARVLPDRRTRHRAGHHLPVGRPDDHDGTRVHGRDPVRRRPHPRGHPGAGRAADVQVARHRDRPARPDRGRAAPPGVQGGRELPRLRRRRPALGAAGDGVEPGHPLQRGEGRSGPAADQQAVERFAADPPADRSRCPAGDQPEHGRGPLDPVAAGAGDGLDPRADR